MTGLFSTDGLLIGTIIPFLFVLTVVVFVHEMGHYLVGRWCGIGVRAFSIGFGPELFGSTTATARAETRRSARRYVSSSATWPSPANPIPRRWNG